VPELGRASSSTAAAPRRCIDPLANGQVRDETDKWAGKLPLFARSDSMFPVRLVGFTSITLNMNRRYAYRDYEILVSAQPSGSQAGWRPEICVIAPDDHWQFVPTHHGLLANDPGYCLEIGRRCAESAIQSMDARREMASYAGHWH
jgi:hypothetical protein